MGFPPASEPCTSHQKQGHEYEDESPHGTNEPLWWGTREATR